MPHIGGSSVVTLGLEQTNLLRSQESCKLGLQLYVKTFSLENGIDDDNQQQCCGAGRCRLEGPTPAPA